MALGYVKLLADVLAGQAPENADRRISTPSRQDRKTGGGRKNPSARRSAMGPYMMGADQQSTYQF